MHPHQPSNTACTLIGQVHPAASNISIVLANLTAFSANAKGPCFFLKLSSSNNDTYKLNLSAEQPRSSGTVMNNVILRSAATAPHQW